MKGKEMMVISIIIIILLVIIIVAVSAKNKNEEMLNNMVTEDVENEKENKVTEENKEKIGEYEKVLLDGTKINTSEELSKIKSIEGLEISNIKVTESNNTTKLTADVKNTTSQKSGDFGVKIKFVDKEGKDIATLSGYIDEVEAGESVELIASIGQDVVNAYNVIISK